MNEITIAPIKTDQVTQITIDSEKMLLDAQSLKITSQEEYSVAGQGLQVIKSKMKSLEESRKNIVQPLALAKKRIDELYKKPMSILETAENLIKQGMIKYSEYEEKKRQEAEEKLRKEIEKKAQRAEASGKVEKAETLRSQAEVVTIAPTVEKPSGISYRDKYYAIVTDINLVPREYMIPNQSALDKIVSATKGTVSIPGVSVKVEKIVVTRTSEF